jgi:hypothetical protein
MTKIWGTDIHFYLPGSKNNPAKTDTTSTSTSTGTPTATPTGTSGGPGSAALQSPGAKHKWIKSVGGFALTKKNPAPATGGATTTTNTATANTSSNITEDINPTLTSPTPINPNLSSATSGNTNDVSSGMPPAPPTQSTVPNTHDMVLTVNNEDKVEWAKLAPSGNAQRSRVFSLMYGHKNDVPNHVVDSNFHDGVWPTERYRKQTAETGTLTRKNRIAAEHMLDSPAGKAPPAPPADSTPYRGPNSVPNILHWVWAGPEVSQGDLHNMLEFARTHPNHDLNIWTDDRDAIIAALDKMEPENRGLVQQYDDITNFKKRLKIQAGDALFENNGLTDAQNNALRNICLREKNGVYRNYAAYSDVIRLLAVLKHPGLYMDVDVKLEPHTNNPALATLENLDTVKGILQRKSSNSVIGVAPAGRPAIRKALERIISVYKYGEDSPLHRSYVKNMNAFELPQRGDASWVAKRVQGIDPDPYGLPIDRVGLTIHGSGPGVLRGAITEETGEKGKLDGDPTLFQHGFSDDESTDSWR